MFRITTALSGLSLLALASCAAEPDSKRYTSYTPRAELARRVAPPPPAPEVTMSRLSSRHLVALSYSEMGRSSYICTPSGFGQKSSCYARN